MGSPSSLCPFLGPQEAVFCLSLFRLLLLSLSCFLFLENAEEKLVSISIPSSYSVV